METKPWHHDRSSGAMLELWVFWLAQGMQCLNSGSSIHSPLHPLPYLLSYNEMKSLWSNQMLSSHTHTQLDLGLHNPCLCHPRDWSCQIEPMSWSIHPSGLLQLQGRLLHRLELFLMKSWSQVKSQELKIQKVPNSQPMLKFKKGRPWIPRLVTKHASYWAYPFLIEVQLDDVAMVTGRFNKVNLRYTPMAPRFLFHSIGGSLCFALLIMAVCLSCLLAFRVGLGNSIITIGIRIRTARSFFVRPLVTLFILLVVFFTWNQPETKASRLNAQTFPTFWRWWNK